MDLTPEGQVDLDAQIIKALEHDIPRLKEEVATLKALAGQGDPAKGATLQHTMALVPIADLEEMAHMLHAYIDGDHAESLHAKISAHIAGETLIGATTSPEPLRGEEPVYKAYCENWENHNKRTNEMWGASSMPPPDEPLSYSEWIDAGRPYNHPDHKN